MTPGVTSAFTLDNIAAIGLTDSKCTGDYISIPGEQILNDTIVLHYRTQRYNTQHMNTEHNHNQYNDTEHNSIQPNVTKHYDT